MHCTPWYQRSVLRHRAALRRFGGCPTKRRLEMIAVRKPHDFVRSRKGFPEIIDVWVEEWRRVNRSKPAKAFRSCEPASRLRSLRAPCEEKETTMENGAPANWKLKSVPVQRSEQARSLTDQELKSPPVQRSEQAQTGSPRSVHPG